MEKEIYCVATAVKGREGYYRIWTVNPRKKTYSISGGAMKATAQYWQDNPDIRREELPSTYSEANGY